MKETEDRLVTELVAKLADQIRRGREHDLAIALDFDGVCKLFTEFKHQIMATCLFLHLREFQRVPFPVFRAAYRYINFRSPDYAGKERFLCVDALSRHLAEKGFPCSLPGLHRAVDELRKTGRKISEENLLSFADSGDVSRAVEWSREVNRRVGQLTEIGLTPGLESSILGPNRETADFYVVSTATEAPLKESLERESVTFIRRYFGQETATKAEALMAISRAGYSAVFMFGDSIEDQKASRLAGDRVPEGVILLFVPVVPGDESRSFEDGAAMIRMVREGDVSSAEAMSRRLTEEFQGREAGASCEAPM